MEISDDQFLSCLFCALLAFAFGLSVGFTWGYLVNEFDTAEEARKRAKQGQDSRQPTKTRPEANTEVGDSP